jgi:hypothetical protein
VRVKLLCSIR